MTDLVVVRHGETVWHHEHRYAGASDIALTPLGLQQAAQLARWAVGARVAAVWASPLRRARVTALACAEKLGMSMVVDERLRELDFGSAEGLTPDELEDRFPEAMRAFRADPVRNHLPGGEDPVDGAARFTECLREIAAGHDGERVLVVAHGTAMRLAMCALLGLPLREYRQTFPMVRNAAITELRLVDGAASLLEFNTPIVWAAGPGSRA
jgi:probable phosphoglycerate mutase